MRNWAPVTLLCVVCAPALANEPTISSGAVGQAGASVAQPLSATAIEELSFGTFVVAGDAAGAITVNDNAEVRHTQNLTPICQLTSGCSAGPAAFLITGESERRYGVTLPKSLLLRGIAASSEMSVDQLTARSSNGGALYNAGQLGLDGQDLLIVGGRLAVPAKSRPDQYSGEMILTVVYY